MKKNSFLSRAAEGRGFYIALILCVIAVGIGSWAVLRNIDNVSHVVTARMPDTGEDVFIPQTAAPSATVKPVISPTPYNKQQKPVSFAWPVSGEISLPYAVDSLIYNPTMADWRTHSGMDIKCEVGTEVLAASDGIVASIENGGMLGTTVIINHEDGLKSIYANLNTAVSVAKGENVKSGQVIAKVGQTSVSEAGAEPHLHFDMMVNDNHVSPLEYLPKT